MNYNRLLLSMAFCSAILLSGCNPDDEGPGNADSLDKQLQDALTQTGGSQGMDLFKLPASTDLSGIPQDPLNPLTAEKVALGQLLFHETAIAINPNQVDGEGSYSCASCHHAAAGFQAGKAQGIGEGGSGFGSRGDGREKRTEYDGATLDVQPIRTPSAMNTAYQKNMLWNGQFGATGINSGTDAYWTPGTPKEDNIFGYEGLEIQAIAGLNVHRLKIEGSLCEVNAEYVQLFADAFPAVAEADRITREYAGLAIGAYERTLLSNEAPFQKWLNGDQSAMGDAEKRGALLFFGKAECSSCHTGPTLNKMEFYALGMNDLRVLPNIFQIKDEDHKGRADFTGLPADMYKFKVPQLYNLKDSPFFGHGASFNTVREVVEYKNKGVTENSVVSATQIASEFKPLGLSEEEITDLTAFLETSLYDANLNRYVPAALPSGQCFPNNDAQSKIDLGCN